MEQKSDQSKEVADIGTPRILVMGVGGGGCNTVVHGASNLLREAEVVAADTDAQSLKKCKGVERLQLGAKVMHGVSAAGDAGLGKRVAEVDTRAMSERFQGVDLVFFVVGLGGGTGSGAAPVLAKQARHAGAMTLCFATMPFEFEGTVRMRQAEAGLAELKHASDVVVTFPNQKLFEMLGPSASLVAAFGKVDETVSLCIRSIWNLLTQVGIMNLDFADFKAVMSEHKGRCTMAHVVGSGDEKARDAVKGIMNSPFFDAGQVLANAGALLLGIVGGEDITLAEIQEVMRGITAMAKPNVRMVMGTALDKRYGSRISLTVLASDAEYEEPESKKQPAEEPEKKTKKVSAKDKGKKKKAKQTRLNLDQSGKGRFKDVEPTIHDGEDLDIPTFVRRGIQLTK